MTDSERIAAWRLASQLLEPRAPREPAAVVAHLCGVQAQDPRKAPWAVGVRAPGVTLERVDEALRDGRVVRTWMFRGTLHYVAAEDLAWLRELLAPGVVARAVRRYRELELDEATFDRSREVLQTALEGKGTVRRAELARRLEDHGIDTAGQRLPHLLQRAALDGVLVCGSSRAPGADYTAAPAAPTGLVRGSEALARLARRYLEGHAPTTVHDFAWWSGLSVRDARRALQGSGGEELHLGPRALWTIGTAPEPPSRGAVRLLPPFDEYLVGYKDRTAAVAPELAGSVNAGGGMLAPTVIVGGVVVATWRYDATAGVATVDPFRALSDDERDRIDVAAAEVAAFHRTVPGARPA